MKKNLILMLIAIFGGFFAVTQVNAQCPNDMKGDPKCPDTKLYEDQAVIRIQNFMNKIQQLKDELKSLQAKYSSSEKELEDTKTSLKDCNDALYQLLGASMSDVDAFRQKLGVIEGKVRAMQRLSDDVLADKQDDVYALEGELNELRKVKIALLPEFFNKIVQLAKQINPGLIREKKIHNYIVKSWFENRDCLWNISGNVDIYGDPLQWPKIWQANTSIVRNPDIIHPGQELVIPEKGPKTTDEIKAERRYWRKKHEQMETEETTGEKGQ